VAIYGLGAYYDKDISSYFVQSGFACIGWAKEDAPALHRLISSIKVGDIIYLKSFSPSKGLTIKAVGVVCYFDEVIKERRELGEACIPVEWIWTGQYVFGFVPDKNNVYSNTLYEEFNPEVQKAVLKLLLDKLSSTNKPSTGEQ